MNCKDINSKLASIDHVLDYIVLDAGQCVYLIISTGGFSTYMPTQGVKEVTEDEARVIAENYWHSKTLETKLRHLSMA